MNNHYDENKLSLQNSVQELINKLNMKHDELVQTGDIRTITFYEERGINGAELVNLKDGSVGIAASVLAFDSERDKNLEIKDSNGNHVCFLSEPELLIGIGTPHVVLCKDSNNLYVASYGNEYSYVACYKMGGFEKVWKTNAYGSRIQSITVNDDYLIIFDMSDGKIKYLNKANGEFINNKNISTDYKNAQFNIRSHHNLATNNEKLLAGVPGLKLGLLDFENELKLYDNYSTEKLAHRKVTNLIGTLNSLAIDNNNNRVYIAFDNKVAVFSNEGYKGFFLSPKKRVTKLNYDQDTGCLMVSSADFPEGNVEVYNPSALEKLLLTSYELRSNLNSKQITDGAELNSMHM